MAVIANLHEIVDSAIDNNVNAQAAIDAVTNAQTAASGASNSESAAETYASQTSADKIATAADVVSSGVNATTAEEQADIATAKASEASESASDAGGYSSSAEGYRDDCIAYLGAINIKYDEFDDRYLGAKMSSPSVDNDGNVLQEGALYWNMDIKGMMVYTGVAWAEVAAASGALLITNNLSDVVDTAAARSNLDVESSIELDGRDTANRSTDNHVDGVANGVYTLTERTKLAGVEESADVTDTVNVEAAGALMDSELTSEAAVKALNQGVSTTDSPTFADASVAGRTVSADGTKLDTLKSDYDTFTARTDNPHSVTKAQVGLDQVDNTSDLDKPVSTATQTALDTKQDTLVNQVNIKSVNGNTLVGSGDLEIATGTGGYAGDLYFTDTISTVVGGYKQLSYSPDVAETTETIVCNTGETAGSVYLYEEVIDTTLIDAGKWTANFYASVDSNVGETYIRYEAFVRSDAGVETTLFTSTSQELTTDVGYVTWEHIEMTFTVNDTDRYGIRLFANTTSNSDKTVSIRVGDGYASYTNTPVATRHNQLRGREQEDQHPISAITNLQSELDGKAGVATTLAGYGITDADTSAEVDAKIAAIVDSAPGTLDTLNELAAALGDDANFSTTVTNSIATKQDILSEGSFVDGDKTKLDGIEAAAKDDQVASEVPVTPNGSLSSTTVQSGLEELQADIDELNNGTW